MAVKASFLATGLTTRVHGNTKKLPKHALKLDEEEKSQVIKHTHTEGGLHTFIHITGA